MHEYIDLHCDTLMTAFEERVHTIAETPRMVSLELLRKAHCAAQVFAVFLPPDEEFETADAYLGYNAESYADYLINVFRQSLLDYPDELVHLKSFSDYTKARTEKRTAALLSFEDGRLIRGSHERLSEYFKEGFRLITLTWNGDNCFGHPHSQDPEKMGLGLTAFGREAVQQMQELGMIVDVSHLSDGGFDDVADILKGPFAASHSNCRSLSPHTRNLDDKRLRIMAEHGGVCGLNFCNLFLNADMSSDKAPLETLVAHVLHMIKVGGTDLPCLGTDFDGISRNVELPDPTHLERLFHALQKAGLSEGQLEKFARGNVERLFRDVLPG